MARMVVRLLILTNGVRRRSCTTVHTSSSSSQLGPFGQKHQQWAIYGPSFFIGENAAKRAHHAIRRFASALTVLPCKLFTFNFPLSTIVQYAATAIIAALSPVKASGG